MPAAKPRLLMLTHRFPYPPNRGDRIRSYNLLRQLAQIYGITLGSISDESVSKLELLHVQEFCEQVLIVQPGKLRRLIGAAKSFLNRKSITEGMFASQLLAKQIRQHHQASPYDVVLVFCSSMFAYVDQPAFENTRIVVDLVDVDSRKWAQLGRESGFFKNPIFKRESRRVRELEQRIANTVDAVTLVSKEEASVYRETVNVPKSQTVVGVSNGVDTEYFQPPSRQTSTSSKACSELGGLTSKSDGSTNSSPELRLVFTGVMNYSPNVSGMEWFCRDILPKLQEKIDVSLKIVGKSPNAQIQSLAKLKGVEVIGPVPDMRPYLAEADIAISPLKLARGIQNKVLEAMAMGCPVVCTSQSSQGIDGVHGTHFIIADTAEDWCRALTEMQSDPARRERLSTVARQLVEDSYSWPAKLHPMLDLLNPHPTK